MWTYWRDEFAEYGAWSGDDAPVSGLHFHDEQQLTFVISGCRLFRIGRERIFLSAGSCLYIPAGCPHASLPAEHSGTRCLNLYIHDLPFGVQPHVLTFRSNAGAHVSTIRALFPASDVFPEDQSIARVAAKAGLSREAFTRKFTRQFGISPHAHRILARLNDARRQLRSGAPLADVAVACGFFDQSHLARHFFRVSGITPGTYRKSLGRSQTYER